MCLDPHTDKERWEGRGHCDSGSYRQKGSHQAAKIQSVCVCMGGGPRLPELPNNSGYWGAGRKWFFESVLVIRFWVLLLTGRQTFLYGDCARGISTCWLPRLCAARSAPLPPTTQTASMRHHPPSATPASASPTVFRSEPRGRPGPH